MCSGVLGLLGVLSVFGVLGLLGVLSVFRRVRLARHFSWRFTAPFRSLALRRLLNVGARGDRQRRSH